MFDQIGIYLFVNLKFRKKLLLVLTESLHLVLK